MYFHYCSQLFFSMRLIFETLLFFFFILLVFILSYVPYVWSQGRAQWNEMDQGWCLPACLTAGFGAHPNASFLMWASMLSALSWQADLCLCGTFAVSQHRCGLADPTEPIHSPLGSFSAFSHEQLLMGLRSLRNRVTQRLEEAQFVSSEDRNPSEGQVSPRPGVTHCFWCMNTDTTPLGQPLPFLTASRF